MAAFGLFVVAGYESYMSFVWEKTVSAPIRLDIFVIDFPLMFHIDKCRRARLV